jgi:phage baseplate assembly protein W
VADAHLLTDLRLRLHHRELRPVYTVDSDGRDLARVSGRENLAQAIVLRLLTPRGELAALGHPEYGSRLEDLVGRDQTVTTRNRIKLHVLEALQAEPRIASVEEVLVAPRADSRTAVDVQVRVRPVGAGAAVVVVGPFTLGLEA